MNTTRTRSIRMKLITLRPKKGRVGVNSRYTQLEVHMRLLQLLITLLLFYIENSYRSGRELAPRKISPVYRSWNNLRPSLCRLLHSQSQYQVQARQAWWSDSELKKALQTPTMCHKANLIKNFTCQRLSPTKCRQLAKFHSCPKQVLKIGKVCLS